MTLRRPSKKLVISAEQVANLFYYRISIPHFLDPEYQGNYVLDFKPADDPAGKAFFDYSSIVSWLDALLTKAVGKDEFLVFFYLLNRIEREKKLEPSFPEGENLFAYNYLELIFEGLHLDPSSPIVKRGFFTEEWPSFKTDFTQEQYDRTLFSLVEEAKEALLRYEKNDALELEDRDLKQHELEQIYSAVRSGQSYPPDAFDTHVGHFCLEKLKDKDIPEIDADLGQEYAGYSAGENGLSAFGYGKDIAKALYYFKKAGNEGLPTAYTSCGYIYLSGDGNLKKDYGQAYTYFYLGAHGKDLEAVFKLSDLYRTGKGMNKNPAKAKKILLSALPHVLSFASLNNPWYLAEYAKRLGILSDDPYVSYAFKLLSYQAFRTRIEQDQHGWDDAMQMKRLSFRMKDFRQNVLRLKGNRPSLFQEVPLPLTLSGNELSLLRKGNFLYPYLPSKFAIEEDVSNGSKKIRLAFLPLKRKDSLLFLALPEEDTVLLKRKFVFEADLSSPLPCGLKKGASLRLSGKTLWFKSGKTRYVLPFESWTLTGYEDPDYSKLPEPSVTNSLPDEEDGEYGIDLND